MMPNMTGSIPRAVMWKQYRVHDYNCRCNIHEQTNEQQYDTDNDKGCHWVIRQIHQVYRHGLGYL